MIGSVVAVYIKRKGQKPIKHIGVLETKGDKVYIRTENGGKLPIGPEMRIVYLEKGN